MGFGECVCVLVLLGVSYAGSDLINGVAGVSEFEIDRLLMVPAVT